MKQVHRDGTMTVSLRYRGKSFRWTSHPDKFFGFDEWKKLYPDDYKKWRAFKKDPGAPMRLKQPVTP